MLTGLQLGNFKAFAETQEVPIRPITLVFGANSSDKSSILHSLLLAHHAMETSEYDVRQPKLAGELVDLGGYQNYVHQHDPTRAVTFGLATAVDPLILADHLHGKTEEKSPFGKLSQFGIELNLEAGTDADEEKPTRSGAALKKIGISIDGRPALEFSHTNGRKFKAQLVSPMHPFISSILEHMTRFSAALEARKAAQADLTADYLRDAPMSPDTKVPSTPGFVLKPIADAADVRALSAVFAEVLAEREFSFERFRLTDTPDRGLNEDAWEWAEWLAQLEAGLFGALEAFQDPSDKRAWWPEAQAVRFNLSNLLIFFTTAIAKALSGVCYLGPVRNVPSRHLMILGSQDPGLLAGGSQAWELACKTPHVLEAVNKWLSSDYLGTPYRLKARQLFDAERLREALKEVSEEGQKPSTPGAQIEAIVQRLARTSELTDLVFEDVSAGTIVSHRDIGFGVGQVLPILVNACALKERLIAIEQPELHLHPAQQAKLGDVFIESALGEQKNTFLLETHSEHLILRIMRRMRETHAGKLPAHVPPVTPNDVSILYVEKDGTRSIVRAFPLNEKGELVKAWPGGFFEEGLRELFD